ncbi:MAG: hypothetical protein ACKERG_00495 [Candidatus Hodgkinia cicadicola]
MSKCGWCWDPLPSVFPLSSRKPTAAGKRRLRGYMCVYEWTWEEETQRPDG